MISNAILTAPKTTTTPRTNKKLLDHTSKAARHLIAARRELELAHEKAWELFAEVSESPNEYLFRMATSVIERVQYADNSIKKNTDSLNLLSDFLSPDYNS